MQDRKQSSRVSAKWIAGIALAVLALGGGAAWIAKSSLQRANPPEVTTPSPNAIEQPSQQPIVREEQVAIYWLKPTENSLDLVASQLSLPQSTETSNDEVLQQALAKLLEGPKLETQTTTIPEGTKLLSLETKEDGIHVNLSQEFTSGGGSASMSGRLAQVIYTATSLNPDRQVWIEVEGEPIEYLGGEGLILDQPMTRETFKAEFAL